MKSKLTAFFTVLLMIISASAGMIFISDADSSFTNLPGGGVEEFNDLSSLSSDNDNNGFILSNDQTNPSDNSVDIDSVKVNEEDRLVYTSGGKDVGSKYISITNRDGLASF